MLVAALIAQYLRIDIEPFGPETDRLLLGPRRWFRRRHRLSAQHGADARKQLAQLTRLGEIVVGAELEADDAIDGARGCGQHDDRAVGIFLHARATGMRL